MFQRVVVPGLALLALVSCASRPPLASNGQLTVVDSSVLPPPDGVDLAAHSRTYILGPLDRVTVTVFGVPDLGGTVQVDSGGRIAIPLAGVFSVTGLTPEQLQEQITQRLAGRFVRNPEVAVNVAEALSQRLTLEGEVKEPGLYPLGGPTTLMQAVAMAKGTTEFAKLNDVVIFRVVNGRRMAALYNLGAIRRGIYEDPQVYAHDTVIVGDSQARRIFKDVLQSAPLLTAPLIAFAN